MYPVENASFHFDFYCKHLYVVGQAVIGNHLEELGAEKRHKKRQNYLHLHGPFKLSCLVNRGPYSSQHTLTMLLHRTQP